MLDDPPELITVDKQSNDQTVYTPIFEKQIVRRTNRLIRVRKLMCPLAFLESLHP
jgi:hypothetical protein